MREFKLAKFSLTQNFEENAKYLGRMHEENWVLMCDPLVVRSDYSYILYHHYRDTHKPEGPYREPGM
jgi:hypothetical protein